MYRKVEATPTPPENFAFPMEGKREIRSLAINVISMLHQRVHQCGAKFWHHSTRPTADL
jgi:hypothetical protein